MVYGHNVFINWSGLFGITEWNETIDESLHFKNDTNTSEKSLHIYLAMVINVCHTLGHTLQLCSMISCKMFSWKSKEYSLLSTSLAHTMSTVNQN